MKVREAILSILIALLPIAAVAGDLKIEAAYIPEPPPSVAVAAAYFTVTNGAEAPIVIVGAAVDARRSDGVSLSLHRSTVEGGIGRMVPIDRLTIAPGASLVFEPGGLHVMIHGSTWSSGDEFRFFLVSEDEERFPVSARVRRRGDAPGDDHDHSAHRGEPQ